MCISICTKAVSFPTVRFHGWIGTSEEDLIVIGVCELLLEVGVGSVGLLVVEDDDASVVLVILSFTAALNSVSLTLASDELIFVVFLVLSSTVFWPAKIIWNNEIN